ncbi:hypothetical protein JOM56_012367, partial [Amanita muscaria]
YTLGVGLFKNDYHLDVVRSSLIRSLATKLTDVQDEIEIAFNDHIKAKTERFELKLTDCRLGYGHDLFDCNGHCMQNK